MVEFDLRKIATRDGAIAWGAFLALAITVLWSVSVTAMEAWSNRQLLAAKTVLVEGIEAAAARKAGTGASEDPEGTLFLEGANRIDASAGLQDHLEGELAESDVAPASFFLSFPDTGTAETGTIEPVRALLEFEIDEGELPDLLYRLETGTPFLVLDRLVIERKTESADDMETDLSGWPLLSVTLEANAFRKTGEVAQ